MKQIANNGHVSAICCNEVVPLQQRKTDAQKQIMWAMEHQINEDLYEKGLISLEMYNAAKISLEMEQERGVLHRECPKS